MTMQPLCADRQTDLDDEHRHQCACQGTRRTLLVLMTIEPADLDALIEAASSFGWTFHDHIDAFEIPILGGARFAALSDVADVLRAYTKQHFGSLRAEWLEPGRTVQQSMKSLLRAGLLEDMLAEEQSSPIVGILEEERIETWFQPIFKAGSLGIWGFECLMRARDEDNEIISPATILEWASTEHLLFTLDRICRERHIHNAARMNVPDHCRFLINFLPSVIYDPAVCLRSTKKAAEQTALAPERIIFEVVETHAVKDRDFLRRILDEYREGGFQVALDDVGAGHSGLSMLADLHPDLIKIDRGLIAGAPDSAAHRSVCKALVDLGHDMDRLVLAEGVETREEYEFVLSLGVDLVQGFLFGRPAPEPVVEASSSAG